MPKTPIETMLDGVAWVPIISDGPPAESDLPYATHEGTLDVAGFTFRVYQLNDGQRLIDADDFNNFFGLVEGMADALAGRTTPIEEVRVKLRSESTDES